METISNKINKHECKWVYEVPMISFFFYLCCAKITWSLLEDFNLILMNHCDPFVDLLNDSFYLMQF